MEVGHSQAGTNLGDHFLWMALDLMMDFSLFLVIELDMKRTDAILHTSDDLSWFPPIKFPPFKLAPGKVVSLLESWLDEIAFV